MGSRATSVSAETKRRAPVSCFARARSSLARKAVLVIVALVAACLSGCATGPLWNYAEDAGVPADILLDDGATLSGSLVEISDDALVFETSVERGEDVEVIRRDGIDYVYIGGVASGTAVEIRDFDIVARQRILLRDTEEISVESRGYVGWGSLLAGVFAFFLVPIVEDSR